MRDTAVQVKPRIYCCEDCVDAWNLQQKSKPAAEQKKDEEKAAYRSLIRCVCDFFDLKAPTPMMYKQIKQYKNEYKMKYSGMELTIEYCTMYVDPPLMPIVKFGLGFIPRYYEAAKEQYIAEQNMRRHLAGLDVNEVTSQTRTIVIDENDRDSHTQSRLIDIADMVVDDD